MRKIMEFKDTGGSIIFVSHDMNAIKILCDAAILLQKGDVVKSGKPAEVTDLFLGIILKKMHQGESEVIINNPPETEKPIPLAPKQVASSGDVEVVSFRILDDLDREVSHITSEANVKIEYEIRSLKLMEDPHYGIAIKNILGVSIFETNTYCMKIKTAPLRKGEIVKVRFVFKCNLSPGDYSICIGVANKGYDRGSFEEYSLVLHDAGILKVVVNHEQIIYGGVYNIMPTVFINDDPSKSRCSRHGEMGR
jgi:lipopolysaccharide transport system ATP-binding protein